MSKRRGSMEIPQQGNHNNAKAQSDKKKLKHKTESDTEYVAMDSLLEKDDDEFDEPPLLDASHRSYSIDSMADGNRRPNQQNASQDADFFRFPEPKTIYLQSTNIGLYSPFTRRDQNSTNTIYHGVPSYLNPNLMRNRRNRARSKSAKINDTDINDNTVPRSKSYEVHSIKKEKNTEITDYELQELEPHTFMRSDEEQSPYLYQELDDTEPNRANIEKQWSIYKSQDHHAVSYVKTTSQKRLLDDFSTLWKRAYFALIILAMFNALLTFGISKAASKVWELEGFINEWHPLQIVYGTPAYILLLIMKVTLVISAIWLTRTFAPSCAGSGVPELRAILSGIWIRHYLSKTTYIIKSIALTLSLSSGIPIGLEGPFIHLSSIMGRQLTKLNVFAHLDRKQMLSAACAGGLASVFGAPIGGVLFSIEVTSTYYPVGNYWTAFCCAMVGSTMTHIFQSLSPSSLLLYETSFRAGDEPAPREFLFSAGLAALCGIMSAFFIYFHDFYVDLRRKYQSNFCGDNPYGIAVVVVVVFTTIFFFMGDFAIEPARKAVSDMFNIEYLNDCDNSIFKGDDLQCNDCDCIDNIIEENPARCLSAVHKDDDILCNQVDYCRCQYHDWINNAGLYWNLSSFYVLNFIFTICSVTLSFPCGIFSPVFTLGSVFGRIYGEIFRKYRYIYCDPRIYSVIGAASMAAGVTQTISPAVIALEITQDLSLAVPCLLAVIISGGLSGSLIHSFYDSVLQLRGIPMLPIRPTVAYKRILMKPKHKRKRKRSKHKNEALSESDLNMELDPRDTDSTPEIMYRLFIADDVMNKEFSFVTIDPKSDELVDILTNYDQVWFPIVHTHSEAVLVGEVRRTVLMDLLKAIDPHKYDNDIPEPLRLSHISFYNQSSTMLKDKASLLGDTMLLNENRSKQAQTFKDKLVKWRSKKAHKRSLSDRNVIDIVDVNGHNEDEHKIKMTLMSSGFIERINLSPIQVISEMPLTKIYTLFHILKPQNVYVTKYSRLIGVINEVQLLQREFETQKGSNKTKMIRLKCTKCCNSCKRVICCCC